MKTPDIFHNIVELVFPNLCSACEKPLITGEQILCLNCQLTLPGTDYAQYKENPIEKHFYGKTHIEAATALFHFSKSSRVQHLIHQLKYKKRQDIGIYLGKLMGNTLSNASRFKDVELIIPVPLHPAKLLKRGYNQSALISKGISESLQIAYSDSLVTRTIYTETQTKKRRMQRFQNVENIFTIHSPQEIIHKHILLVDDVITTGSTLESCANEILKIPETRVSVAALAHVKH